MAIPLTINGATFEYPENFDENWGVEATGWAQAVTNGMLQMQGGNFPITADINFGPNFGLLSKYFETRSSNPATTGTVRLSSADAGIAWRNNANNGNLILTTDSSDNLLYNGSPISGGVSAGTQYKLGYYATTSNVISPNPNTMAATQALVSDANGVPTTTGNGGTTATEIGYVHGVTSSIQTQLNAAVTSVSGTANQITSTGGTTPVLAIANPLTLPGPMTAGGAIAMAANKITGLANGTVAQDAAAFGQLIVFTDWVTYTPSFSAGYGTVINVSFFWRQIGNTVFVKGTAQAGTVTAGGLTISLPSGKPINYSKMPTNGGGNSTPLGTYGIARATPFVGLVIGDGTTTTSIAWTSGSASGSPGSVFATATGNSVFDNNDFFVVDFNYAI